MIICAVIYGLVCSYILSGLDCYALMYSYSGLIYSYVLSLMS